jgi:hypothetical protein
MSLNLISSLSFLKSRLGSGPFAERAGGKGGTAGTARIELKGSAASLDLYGGVTESDLESSSSESEDFDEDQQISDSSR